jgi:hypothetical protein
MWVNKFRNPRHLSVIFKAVAAKADADVPCKLLQKKCPLSPLEGKEQKNA